jgi:plastocyanin
MPGPSLAPALVAAGAFAFLLATLFLRVEQATDEGTGAAIPDSTTIVLEPFGILALLVGLGALVGALLYWGREANREYDALEPPPALPATAREEPPPGVHVPGPSFRPLLASIAASAMLLGLVIDPVVLVAGVLMTVIGLLGWLSDARREYRHVETADRTGRLESTPAPGFPIRTLIVFAVLFVGSLLIAGGIVPPREATPGGADGAPSAGPPATPTPAPSASSAPGTSLPPGESVTLTLVAQGIAFDRDTLEAPANTPFRIEFSNNDPGIPHNVAIHEGTPTGPEVWRGELFNGVETRTYEVPALPAGTYGFVCTVHPNMTGTLTVR